MKSAKVTAELTACCIQVCMEGMLARSQFDSFFLFCFFVTLAQWIKDWWYNIVQQQAMFPREFLVLLLAGGSAHYLFFFSYWKFYTHLLLYHIYSKIAWPFMNEANMHTPPLCTWKDQSLLFTKGDEQRVLHWKCWGSKCELRWNFEHANIMLGALTQVPFFLIQTWPLPRHSLEVLIICHCTLSGKVDVDSVHKKVNQFVSKYVWVG